MAKPFRDRIFRSVQNTSIWFDSRFTAAGRLLLLGLIIACIYALDPRQTSAYQLAAAIAGAMIVAFLLSFAKHRRFEIRRTLPKFLTVGETGLYTIQITNLTSQKSNDISVRDRLSPGMMPSAASSAFVEESQLGWIERKLGFLPWLSKQRHLLGARLLPSAVHSVAAGGSISISQDIVPLRRGNIYFKGTDIRQTEILGLVRHVRHYHCQDKITALPPRIELPSVAWQSQRLFHRGGITVASTVGDSQEFIGLRDYRPGDPLRQIHWRSFAKLGHPVVREFQDEYFNHHALVLDTSVRYGEEFLFEVAASVAVSFVQTKQPNDSLLDLVMVDDFSWSATAGRGANDRAHLLEHIAIVTARVDNGTTRDRALHTKKLMHCNSVVFITCRADQQSKDSVSKLRRAGISVLALCIVKNKVALEDFHQIEATLVGQQLPALLEKLGHANR